MPLRTPIEAMPPEALLADYPPTHVAIAEELRSIVVDAVPDAVERVRAGWRLIGYDLPLRRHGTMFAWIWLEPEHIHLGFPRGIEMDDADQVLIGVGVTKQARWLTYEPGASVDAGQAAGLVREAARVAVIPRSAR